MVKFQANVNVEGKGVYSVSVGDDRFCPFVYIQKEGEEANKKC